MYVHTNRCSYKLLQSLLTSTEGNLIERLLDQYEPVRLYLIDEGTVTKVQQLLNSFFYKKKIACAYFKYDYNYI